MARQWAPNDHRGMGAAGALACRFTEMQCVIRRTGSVRHDNSSSMIPRSKAHCEREPQSATRTDCSARNSEGSPPGPHKASCRDIAKLDALPTLNVPPGIASGGSSCWRVPRFAVRRTRTKRRSSADGEDAAAEQRQPRRCNRGTLRDVDFDATGPLSKRAGGTKRFAPQKPFAKCTLRASCVLGDEPCGNR